MLGGSATSAVPVASPAELTLECYTDHNAVHTWNIFCQIFI